MPGALVLLDPDPQHVLDPVQVDPDRQVHRLGTHRPPVADLRDQRIDVDDRIHLVQGPVLPGLHVLEHLVGDPRDRVVRHLYPDRAGQMVADVADRHPAGVQRDHRV